MSEAETIAELKRLLDIEKRKSALFQEAYANVNTDAIKLLRSLHDKLKDQESSVGLPRDFYYQSVGKYIDTQEAAFDAIKNRLKEIEDGK